MASDKESLDDIFDNFLRSPTIFKNRDVLRATYVPDELPHREEHIARLGMILSSALKGSVPSNVFIYGKTGTGKTAAAKYVLKHLSAKTKVSEPDGLALSAAYVNCRVVDTNYRVLANLCKEIGLDVPFTGLPTDEVYRRFLEEISDKRQLIIIVLDEIDMLVKKDGDDVLYELTRINTSLKQGKVSLVGISNDLRFKDYLDPRVVSSLSEEEVVFPPYTATELQDILKQRAAIGFRDQVVDDSVINLCAALAAREHGDARRALDLLRVAGDLCERAGERKVSEKHVRSAQGRIEYDTVTETLRTLPLQSKLVLYTTYLLEKQGEEEVVTGSVFEVYSELCGKLGLDMLTQRRVGDLVNELDMLGIINAKVESKGRYGRTKKIKLLVPQNQVKEVLEEDEKIKNVSSYIPKLSRQYTL
ncbi:MAG: ORC1-type DNA replication protein [Candidatus Atabeyarchaeum deiterrae]